MTLPNFGEERAIADTLRLAGLNVPVLVQATPDTPAKMTIASPPRQLLRQDVGLQQPDAVRHPLLADHAAHRSPGFRRVRARISTGSPPSAASSNGLRRLRIGAIGARPAAFNTVRYSEKILEAQRHLRRDHRPL